MSAVVWVEHDHEGFCTACDQRVKTRRDGQCMSCDGPTAPAMGKAERVVRLNVVCPSCRGAKSRGSLRCRSCATRAQDRDELGRIKPKIRAADRLCPDCGSKKQPGALRCWSCYLAAGGHRGRKHAKGRALQRITNEVLAEAYELYRGGLSIRAVAREVLERTEYKNERSAANSLFDLFKARGWELRDRRQAVAKHNRERAAELPLCTFVRANGERCDRHTAQGVCNKHRDVRERLAELHRSEARKAVAA